MALINLPEGAQWDTDLTHYTEQSQEAKTYLWTTIGAETPTTLTEEELNGSGQFRPLTRQWVDTANSLTVVETREYMYNHDHPACGALKNFDFQIS